MICGYSVSKSQDGVCRIILSFLDLSYFGFLTPGQDESKSTSSSLSIQSTLKYMQNHYEIEAGSYLALLKNKAPAISAKHLKNKLEETGKTR